MRPSTKSMTLDEFLSLSPEQRRGMTARESGPFFAQMAVENLNRNVLEQDRKDQASQSTIALQAGRSASKARM